MTWPRMTVSNYEEMLRKLSFCAFVVSIGCIALLRSKIDIVETYFSVLDVKMPWTLFEIPSATVGIAVLVAVLSEATKLHDKISAIFKIRHEFDLRWILLPAALLSGAKVDSLKWERLKASRHNCMQQVFYRYVSSGSENNKEIDQHAITQALTAWSWVWLCAETALFLFLTGAILLGFGVYNYAALVFVFVVILLVAQRVLSFEAKKYAEDELRQILSNAKRRQAVRAVFDAL